MTIIITDEDVKRLLPMRDCIEAMRVAFCYLATGAAINRPRMRYLARHPDPERKYLANVRVGAVPSYGMACVRAGSQVIRPPRSSLPLRAASCIAKQLPKARTRTFRPNGWAVTYQPTIRPASGRRREREVFIKRIATLATLVAANLLGSATVSAAADFYRGKRINFVIGYGTGGGYDIYARLLARFIGEHIPGNPTVVPQNMPGTGAAAIPGRH
jgi:hypothetical protein